MEEKNKYTDDLLQKITRLEEQLFDANALVEAIKDGSIDAFVLNKEGRPDIYALESIDYTYRILIEKFGEGALSISQDGLILYCNFYFSKLLGVPISSIIGSYFRDYVASVNDFNALLGQLKTGLSKGELALKTSAGEVPVYISLNSLQPYLPAIGVIVTDQTLNKSHEKEIFQYQKQLEQKISELNAMNRDLEQFVHIISHDIKEPLRKIISYGDRLKKELHGNVTGQGLKNLNIIHDAIMRLNLLVDDLVQYSSSSSHDHSGFKEVNLDDVIREVLSDIELLMREKKVLVHYHDLPKIYGSDVQMRQLFSNLIINAIKYSKKDQSPVISITTERIPGLKDSKNSFYKICIEDNGIGIEKQYLQKIFTIFQRLHAKTEYSGTGIGLAICKKIVENHQGRIEVESVLNKGSKFSLYLPAL